MKKILLIAPLLMLPTINVMSEDKYLSIKENGYYMEKSSLIETLTENDCSWSKTEDNNIAWVYNLDPIINDLGIEEIQAIKFFQQRVNFRFGAEWKERGFIDVPDYNWHYYYTSDGPGDANNHDGYNESDLDGHSSVDGVWFEETTLEFGHTVDIASGYLVTHYDEYLDDGYGWEDNGSGYHWEDYKIEASYYYDDNLGYEHALKLEWVWTSDMPYDVRWDEVDNSDSVLDTIGNFDIEINYPT